MDRHAKFNFPNRPFKSMEDVDVYLSKADQLHLLEVARKQMMAGRNARQLGAMLVKGMSQEEIVKKLNSFKK